MASRQIQSSVKSASRGVSDNGGKNGREFLLSNGKLTFCIRYRSHPLNEQVFDDQREQHGGVYDPGIGGVPSNLLLLPERR
jgi:hypothetical protein